MKDVMLVIVTALISGLMATIVTIWWQRKSEERSKKMKVFETLMSYRYNFSDQASVNALNSIDVIFYKDSAVRRAYADFLSEAGKKPELNPNINDKHLKLLEVISSSLGLKDIHWDEIKQCYYPIGLAEKTREESVLRKMQIQNTSTELARKKDQENAPANNQYAEQFAIQMLPSLIQNPESLKMLIELSQNSGKPMSSPKNDGDKHDTSNQTKN